MKITKSYLQKVIKEELERALHTEVVDPQQAKDLQDLYNHLLEKIVGIPYYSYDSSKVKNLDDEKLAVLYTSVRFGSEYDVTHPRVKRYIGMLKAKDTSGYGTASPQQRETREKMIGYLNGIYSKLSQNVRSKVGSKAAIATRKMTPSQLNKPGYDTEAE